MTKSPASKPLQRGVTRRQFLAGTAAVAGGWVLLQGGWSRARQFLGPDGLDTGAARAAGYTVKHTLCFQCGASCGLTALVREGAPPSEENFLLFGNQHPDHPQRGFCGRGATAVYTWNSPLRIRKPLKRVGERGEGRFEEISWDQALDEIAAKLKALVDVEGARSVAFTAHDLREYPQWLAWPLGAANTVNQPSTCNTSGISARRWMMGAAYQHHAAVDPDYDHARYVVFPGRSLHAPIGALHRLAKARQQGARAVFLNPAMPEAAFADAEWIPILPGTDAAFLLAVCHTLIHEQRYDAEFVARHTNLPFLLKADDKPLTEADREAGGEVGRFFLYDTASGGLAAHTTEGVAPGLTHRGTVRLADGSSAEVTTAFNRLVEHLAEYTPEYAEGITQVPAATLVRVARELHTRQGVVEDTWYNARNGNDTDAVMAIMTVNALLGNFDQPGGLCFRPGARVPATMSRAADGQVSTLLRHSFRMDDTRSVDRMKYPETNGTFDAVLQAILEGEPYPIKALFVLGTTVLQRDPNTRRVEAALRKLDLIVTNEILAQEITDWSDYVLPAEMFLERRRLSGIPWTLTAAVGWQEAVTRPPPGVEARSDVWIMLEILRRAYPERAALVGYNETLSDHDTFKREFLDKLEDLQLEGLAKSWELDADELRQELATQGFKVLQGQRYGQVPYVRPFATPSGRFEVYAFHPVLRGYREHGFATWFPPPAYTLPAQPDEFYLVSGKNPITASGAAGLAYPARFLSDRAVWLHPADAERLGLSAGDPIEVTGLDVDWTAQAAVRVTPRVKQGVAFIYSFSGGYRQRRVREDDRFRFLSEGLNPHWFAKAHLEPVTGAAANNASVRIRKVSSAVG